MNKARLKQGRSKRETQARKNQSQPSKRNRCNQNRRGINHIKKKDKAIYKTGTEPPKRGAISKGGIQKIIVRIKALALSTLYKKSSCDVQSIQKSSCVIRTV